MGEERWDVLGSGSQRWSRDGCARCRTAGAATRSRRRVVPLVTLLAAAGPR
ncbi:hypothetical protein FHR75_000852 [Kineococcus radiotolerans]|uniref:Uncharacterized protein n=1 Tax=Kineococcus radiotolerans TaxID=131568 RepID=A0A7W4XWB8_KINRA|nr:hypothetical protein [Kineococcus radiotolerans]MBB2900064.1 hypothetical protein [Kineococcus radiotolerans]